MTIKNLYDAQLLVGFLFASSEKVKKILEGKKGPGLNCYNYEMFNRFLSKEMIEGQEIIFRNHLRNCEWCRLLLEYTEKLSAEVFVSSLINEKATEYFVKHKILPELIDNRFSLARKIRKAWNIL